MQKVKEFIECYNEVFDKNNNVTACGRDKCRKLIIFCEGINKEIDFGDSLTGMMNIENIVNFRKSLGENL